MASNSSLIKKICRIIASCFKALSKSTVKKKITIHHSAGSGSAESAVKLWQKRGKVSTNYYIEKNGDSALIVDEWNQSYASCSTANDKQAVTIEVANCKGAPNWEVSEASVITLIHLCVDICRRNGIPQLIWTGDSKGNLTVHRMFAATACPGPYLYSLMPWIATEVTGRLQGVITGPVKVPGVKFPATNTSTKTPTTASTTKPAAKFSPVFNGIDLSPVFDYLYYSNRYEDLKKAFGTNQEMLFYHFCTAGMKEGRKASSTFDPYVYRSRYKDLNAQFGDNMVLYYKHYCIHGIPEGRKGC